MSSILGSVNHKRKYIKSLKGHNQFFTNFLHHKPRPFQFSGQVYKQKGRDLYVSFMPVKILDIMCSVPAINYTLSNSEISKLVLNPTATSWQRELDPDRVESIENFWEQGNNFIVNSVVLTLNPNKQIDSAEHGTFTAELNFDFLKDTCTNSSCNFTTTDENTLKNVTELNTGLKNYFFDVCPKCGKDYRENTILDGQHRIRGGASSKTNSSLEIPTTFLSSNTPPDIISKIFTEITGFAEPLGDLHGIFLAHKFRHKSKVNFEKSDPTTTKQIGERNKLAYETAAKLNQKPGPWESMIKLLDNNHDHLITADQFITIVSPWFDHTKIGLDDAKSCCGDCQNTPNKIFTTGSKMESADVASTALDDFLRAFDDYDKTDTAWDDKTKKGLFQTNKGLFRCLIKSLFGPITQRIKTRGDSPDYNRYLEELMFIGNIDWSNPRWKQYNTPDKHITQIQRIFSYIYNHNAPRNNTSGIPQKVGSADRLLPSFNDWLGYPPGGSLGQNGIIVAFRKDINATGKPLQSITAPTSSIKEIDFDWTCQKPDWAISPAAPSPKNLLNAELHIEVLITQSVQGSSSPIRIANWSKITSNKFSIDAKDAKNIDPPSVNPQANSIVDIKITYFNPNGSTSAPSCFYQV